MSNLKALLGIQGSRKRQTEAESVDSELSRVNKVLMEFLGSEFAAKELVEELERRRTRAMARIIGLTNLSQTLKSASSETAKQIQGLVASTFSEGFIVEGVKKHYTFGVEGVDPTLIKVIQESYFDIYQQLLNHLNIGTVSTMDCTDNMVTNSFLTIFESLTFPFDVIDNIRVLDLKQDEAMRFMLTWAKGLMI